MSSLAKGGATALCNELNIEVQISYNPKRRHTLSNDLSSVEYEKQYFSA
jgi:hypothetical protein